MSCLVTLWAVVNPPAPSALRCLPGVHLQLPRFPLMLPTFRPHPCQPWREQALARPRHSGMLSWAVHCVLAKLD